MKLHFLPAEQDKRNDLITDKLRRLGYVIFALFLIGLGLGSRLYLWPPALRGIELISSDGKTAFPQPIVLSSDLILCASKITGEVEFRALGEHSSAKPINSSTLPDGTDITLLKLNDPTSATPVSICVLDIGDSLMAITIGGAEYHGTVRSRIESAYAIEPGFDLDPGSAFFRGSDRSSLVGFAFRGKGDILLFPAVDLSRRFSQLQNQ